MDISRLALSILFVFYFILLEALLFSFQAHFYHPRDLYKFSKHDRSLKGGAGGALPPLAKIYKLLKHVKSIFNGNGLVSSVTQSSLSLSLGGLEWFPPSPPTPTLPFHTNYVSHTTTTISLFSRALIHSYTLQPPHSGGGGGGVGHIQMPWKHDYFSLFLGNHLCESKKTQNGWQRDSRRMGSQKDSRRMGWQKDSRRMGSQKDSRRMGSQKDSIRMGSQKDRGRMASGLKSISRKSKSKA